MASTNPTYGTVINKNDVKDIQSGPVATSITLAIGLVYKDAANGWKQAPTDGSIHADQLYWNEKSLTSTATLGAVVGTFYGSGARVVGKADGAIVVDTYCRASETSAHGGQFESLADPSDSITTPLAAQVDAIRDWQRTKIAIYKGHALELNQVDDLPTDAEDEDTNGIYEIRRG
jgi:hypothetical protein